MKKVEVALALLLAVVLVIAGLQVVSLVNAMPSYFPTYQKTIIVPIDYSTIQGAIDAATDGDTVFVRKGIYNETLVINKTISLIGEDRENTIIDAQKAKCQVILLHGNNITVANFTLGNNGYGPATSKYWFPQNGEGVGINIDYNSSSNLVANNTIIDSAYQSIYIGVSKYNSIVGNTIVHSFEGIHIYGVENTIANNSFADVSQSIGFQAKYLSWDRTELYELAKDNFIQGNQNVTLTTIPSPFPSLLLNSKKSPVFILSPQNNTVYSSNNVTVVFSEPWGSVTFNQSLYNNHSVQTTQIYPTLNGSAYQYSLQLPDGNYSLVIEVMRYPPFTLSQSVIGSSDAVNFVIMTHTPPVAGSPNWIILPLLAGAALLLVYLLVFLKKHRRKQGEESKLLSKFSVLDVSKVLFLLSAHLQCGVLW